MNEYAWYRHKTKRRAGQQKNQIAHSIQHHISYRADSGVIEAKDAKVIRARFELATFCVLDRCDNQLRHRTDESGDAGARRYIHLAQESLSTARRRCKWLPLLTSACRRKGYSHSTWWSQHCWPQNWLLVSQGCRIQSDTTTNCRPHLHPFPNVRSERRTRLQVY